MKKILIGTSILLSSFLAPTFAEEKNNFYLSVGGGIAFPTDVEGDFTLSGTNYDAGYETKDPFLYGLGIGKEFNDWRVEFNFSGAQIKSDTFFAKTGGAGVTASFTPDLKFNVKNYMVYGYRDIRNESKFTPYIGAGLGTTSYNSEAQTLTIAGTNVSVEKFGKSVFSFGLKGGVNYEISDETILFSEVSYLNGAKFKTNESGTTINYDSNSWVGLLAGVRFNF